MGTFTNTLSCNVPIMVCGHDGVVHDGPQMHPLALYCDSTMTLQNNWVLWRPLMSTQNTERHSKSPLAATKDSEHEDGNDIRLRYHRSDGVLLQNIPPAHFRDIKSKLQASSRSLCGSPFPRSSGDVFSQSCYDESQ